jgi:hypothetical protein
MKVQVNCTLPYPADKVWDLLQYSSTLVYVAGDRVLFDTCNFPKRWVVDYQIDTRVYDAHDSKDPGMYYRFMFDEIDHDQKVMRTREWCELFQHWHHTYAVISQGEHSCLLVNDFDVSAGWKFWITLYLVRKFIPEYYTERHERLRKLLAQS